MNIKQFFVAMAMLLPVAGAMAQNPVATWDGRSLMLDGRRVVPVMGEVHYSRIPAAEWQQEIRKMKEGGVTMIACYVFWNHIEQIEGQFDWSGQRDLRTFLELCWQERLPVVLRVGPFCHGEVRNGGIPDWVFTKGCKTRSEDPLFLKYVERLYRQIFTQFQGLQWKDGGPVIAAQFDNEYRGKASYLLALKRIATAIGFDLPFYTRTGWPALSTPMPFGEMIPLYGDYADGFWDRSIEETAGNYYKAFNFTASQVSGAIGSEQLDYGNGHTVNSKSANSKSTYPYFTCELGGGMMTSYHRRVYLYPEDAYAMAVVKLGSGSNLLGYYMYHGGTNPEAKQDGSVQPFAGDSAVYLNESQRTVATNYNDLPVKTYDFQAPLGEFGQVNPHYFLLRKLHLFMHDFGETLAPMDAVFPCEQDIAKGDDSHLRWAYRAQGDSGFIFINNYERLQNLTAKKHVQLEACGVRLPRLTVPAGTVCIFPVNVGGLRYATAQPIARRDNKIYLEQISGIPTEMAIDGRVLKNVKARGMARPVYTSRAGVAYYLVDSETAGRLFCDAPVEEKVAVPIIYNKVREAAGPHTITIGVNGVAQEPLDSDFGRAAVYRISLSGDSSLFALHSSLLSITYRGDVARLYADGRLVADNFYNGRPFQFGLWRLTKDVKELELRILPLQKDMPVYFPREADTREGEDVMEIVMIEKSL